MQDHALFSTSVGLSLNRGSAPVLNLSRKFCCILSELQPPVKPNGPGPQVLKKRIPAQNNNSKKTPQYFRVLPNDLLPSQRPPLPPKHHTLPLIGFAVEALLGVGTSNKKIARKYGPVYRSDGFQFSENIVQDYAAISEIYRHSDVFRSSGAMPTLQDLFGDDSVIALDGDEHTAMRKLLAPAFAPGLFPFYFSTVRNRINLTWERVSKAAARGEKVLLEPVLREHYLSITVEMTTGINMNGKNASNIRELYKNVQRSLFSPPYGPIYDKGIRSRDELLHILAGVVKEKLRTRADAISKLREYGEKVVQQGLKDIAKGGMDVLLVAISSSPLKTDPVASIDEEEVAKLCRMMLLLWFAGYVTAAATSMCVVFELGWDTEYRRKLVVEQEKIVDEADGDVGVTYEQIVSKMPALDAYITEILRYYPAVRGTARVASQDVEVLGRYIPKGVRIFLDIASAHRDAAIYPNANTLDPERFLKQEGKPKPPGVLSFGGAPGSPHYCIGAAFAKVLMKATFASLLREYTFELDPAQSRKYSVLPDSTPKSKIVVQKFVKRTN